MRTGLESIGMWRIAGKARWLDGWEVPPVEEGERERMDSTRRPGGLEVVSAAGRRGSES